MFAPLDLDGGRGVAVANRRGDSIALGLLRDGERLPAQSELAAALGVSLVTLRDGLELLKGRGLVETRRGHKGDSFVKVDERVSTSLHRERLSRMSSHDLVSCQVGVALTDRVGLRRGPHQHRCRGRARL